MSVDIDWEALTSGPDGIALAGQIRDFIHDKFQKIPLPRFISSVRVHSFEFGKIAPEVEIKDICDPLPEFYEDDDNDYDSDEDELSPGSSSLAPSARPSVGEQDVGRDSRQTEEHGKPRPKRRKSHSQPAPVRPFEDLTSSSSTLRPASPRRHFPPAPISGGTTNFGYFHMPLGAGLSGTTTPLVAVAGPRFPSHWHEPLPLRRDHSTDARRHYHSASASSVTPPSSPGISTRPTSKRQTSGAGSSLVEFGSDDDPASEHALDLDFEDSASAAAGDASSERERSPMDLQVVCHVKYRGDVRLALTADLLLDYPMPSFVGIPLELNITGLSFDGVAILATIKRRVHFCFLAPEDAELMLGEAPGGGEAENSRNEAAAGRGDGPRRTHGLLEEIKVESEIGQKENGKPVLKNVGKVEHFVLEQVRRIFEEELVFPSYWTFLV